MLYSLWMKAVCTTFGCCDDVAAAALRPFGAGPLCDASPYAPLTMLPLWSISGLLFGGPIGGAAGGVGVRSIGSSWWTFGGPSAGFEEKGKTGTFPFLL